jgi:hypothetical protein
MTVLGTFGIRYKNGAEGWEGAGAKRQRRAQTVYCHLLFLALRFLRFPFIEAYTMATMPDMSKEPIV